MNELLGYILVALSIYIIGLGLFNVLHDEQGGILAFLRIAHPDPIMKLSAVLLAISALLVFVIPFTSVEYYLAVTAVLLFLMHFGILIARRP